MALEKWCHAQLEDVWFWTEAEQSTFTEAEMKLETQTGFASRSLRRQGLSWRTSSIRQTHGREWIASELGASSAGPRRLQRSMEIKTAQRGASRMKRGA